ncbi:phage tail protein [Pediococcus pentosaceus]|uniref:phage tail protein n=1 Tax=Pediococcus pentosaceus TaxID=1255 RepID=UPI00397AB154
MIKFYNEKGEACFGQATVTRSTGVNGSASISGTIFDGQEVLTKIDRGWWFKFEGDKYVVTYKKLNDNDKTIEFDAVQSFFWDFQKTAFHEQWNGSHEFTAYLEALFKNSGYKYTLDGKVSAFEKENWGYKNKLDLFNDIIQQAEMEFEVYNETIHITKQIGDDLTSIARKGINLSDLVEEMKISDFVTYGKGYGAFKDKDDQSKGRLEVEYRSELAKTYGDLEMDPIVDERYTDATSLTNAIKKQVDASYYISVSMNIYDLENAGYPNYQSPQVGDWLLAIDEALNFKRQIRIIKLEEVFDAAGKRIGYTATCGDLSTADQYQNAQGNVNNRIDDITNQIDDVATSANGKNSNYYGDTEPTNPNDGDLWYDTSSSDSDDWIIYQWHNGRWEQITLNPNQITNEINEANTDMQNAIDEAKKAAEDAEGKVDDFGDSLTIIQGDITQAKSDAANALNNVTVIDSKLTQLSDTTTARFNTLDSGYQLVLDTVNDMDIGAVNLIKNSGDDVVVDDTSTNQGWKHQAVYSELVEGQQYTFSSEVMVNVGKVSEICVNVYNPANGDTKLISNRTINNGKIKYTFTAIKDYPQLLVYAGTMGGTKGNKVTFHHYQLEKGNKVTDWSESPLDFAKETEITVMQGLIDQKVSTDQYTSDKTQTDKIINQTVSKVDGMNTQINQVANDVQILATTGGQKNLVYNSSYSNNAEGWNMFDKLGYLSTLAVSSYNGSPGFGVNISGKSDTTWTQFGQSKFYALPQPDAVATENTYSASAVIKFYEASSKECHISATISYYDKNNKRILWKDMLINGDNIGKWTTVKVENFAVPQGAYYVCMQFWAYGATVHGMVAQPMIVFGSKIGQYQSDNVSTAQLDVAIDAIQTTVTNGLNNLSTQVTQTNSAWQAAVGNLGKANLVVNSELNDGATGWRKGLWYTSENQTSMHNGTVAMGVNQTGLSADTWTTATSLAVNTITSNNRVFSFDVWCLIYSLEGSSTTMATLEFVDKSGKRVQAHDIHADGSIKTWQKLSIANVSAPTGATGYRIQYHLHGTGGHVMYSQPMLVASPTNASVYQPDSVSKADITLAVDNIHLGVKNADGSTATFNMNSSTILLDAAKIMINGTTSIKDATISSAKIASLSADKITAGTLNASKVNVVNLNAANIVTGTIKGANLSINLNTGEVIFQKGRIHSTTNNVDINVDNGYLSVSNDSNRVMLKNGEMQFVAPNWFDVSDNPYFRISNTALSSDLSEGAKLLARDSIMITHTPNDSNPLDTGLGKETFAGVFVGKGGGKYHPTKVGGADRGVNIVGGSSMSSTVSLFGDSPSIKVGVNSQEQFNSNRIAIDGEYVHMLSAFFHSTSGTANLKVADDGALVSIKSASKYKLNINKLTDTEQAHALLAINAKTWYDKAETESIVKTMNEGFDSESFGTPRLKPYLGFIAEDFANAGLEMLVSRNKNGELESINYDRISALEHLNVQELFSRVLQLEKEVHELRSEAK